MATWAAFEEAAPELAARGRALFEEKVLAYLATVRADGGPRVHPVVPILSQGRLFVSVNGDSPKRRDLEREGRYALHALPGDDDEEFYITGAVRREDDATVRSQAHEDAPFTPRKSDPLFAFDIETCMWGRWENVGQPDTHPVRRVWHAP